MTVISLSLQDKGDDPCVSNLISELRPIRLQSRSLAYTFKNLLWRKVTELFKFLCRVLEFMCTHYDRSHFWENVVLSPRLCGAMDGQGRLGTVFMLIECKATICIVRASNRNGKIQSEDQGTKTIKLVIMSWWVTIATYCSGYGRLKPLTNYPARMRKG